LEFIFAIKGPKLDRRGEGIKIIATQNRGQFYTITLGWGNKSINPHLPYLWWGRSRKLVSP